MADLARVESSPVREVYDDGAAPLQTDRVPGQAAALLNCEAGDRNSTKAMTLRQHGMAQVEDRAVQRGPGASCRAPTTGC